MLRIWVESNRQGEYNCQHCLIELTTRLSLLVQFFRKKNEIMKFFFFFFIVMGWTSYESELLGAFILFYFFNELFVEYFVHLLLFGIILLLFGLCLLLFGWPIFIVVILSFNLLFKGLRIIFGGLRLFV